MRFVIKWIGRLVLVLIVAIAGIWAFGPREAADVAARFEGEIGADLDAYLAAREAKFTDIRDGEAMRIVWAGETGAKTPLAVVYFHGFSASSEEIRPVPDEVAAGLGANLVYTRFAGHGRTEDAMAEPSVADWMRDVDEALQIARRVGERVVILSTSTGGTFAAEAAMAPDLAEAIAGIVFVSPNFGINNPAAPLLSWPAARWWLPILVGERREFEPRNAGQAAHWTTSYPNVAALPLAAIVDHAVDLDFAGATIPALFYFTDQDKVVLAERTRHVMAAWGGPVRFVEAPMGAGVDDFGHVVTGDIISPGNTPGTIAAILDWAKGL